MVMNPFLRSQEGNEKIMSTVVHVGPGPLALCHCLLVFMISGFSFWIARDHGIQGLRGHQGGTPHGAPWGPSLKLGLQAPCCPLDPWILPQTDFTFPKLVKMRPGLREGTKKDGNTDLGTLWGKDL